MKKTYNYDMGSPEKIVIVSDSLTTDIMFGNLNNMATVWCNKYANSTD